MQFAIEVTRDCNLQCMHCLRGPKKKQTMSFETIRRAVEFIDSFENVDLVGITGGEPLVAIKETIELARLLDYHIFLSTNAAKHISDDDMALLLLMLGDDVDIQISDDLHHTRECGSRQLGYVDKFKELLELNDIEYSCTKSYLSAPLIKEGRALQRGSRDPGENDYIYINVHGEILIGCNWSYHSQKDKVITSLDRPDPRGDLLRHLQGIPDDDAGERLKELIKPRCSMCPFTCFAPVGSEECMINLIHWINTGEEPCSC